MKGSGTLIPLFLCFLAISGNPIPDSPEVLGSGGRVVFKLSFQLCPCISQKFQIKGILHLTINFGIKGLKIL